MLLAVACLAAGCGGSDGDHKTLEIVVNAPFSTAPQLAETIYRGTLLGVQSTVTQGADGSMVFQAGNTQYRVRVEKRDTGLSPRRAVRNVRAAAADGAAAIVDEGTGIDASWQIAARAGVPVGIVYQGGIGLVDPERRPNVFRIAPTDHGIAFRFAEYLVPKGLKIALLHDDTDYGQQGAVALRQAFSRNPEAVAIRLALPAAQSDLSPQVLRARRAGATALLVWARPSTIADVVIGARGAGWKVPVYTPPAGAEPLVRQQLADQPEWLDGLTFAAGRMTAEAGTDAFFAFQSRYNAAFGPDYVGVRTSDGRRVVQPPELPMYPYDFVRILIAAIVTAGGIDDRQAVLDALHEVTVQGANGDERGFNEKNHEGVVDDDVYFARFRDMMFAPVEDDPLSSTLPVINQIG